jgi:hypothetical protein
MPTAKAPKVSKFQKSYLQTEGMRPFVPKDMLALFDHLLSLAKHSHSVGSAKRAGQELAHARKIALKGGAPKPEPKAPAAPRKYSLERIKLDAGGYERGSGRYYGTGTPLYRVTNNESSASVDFRARDLAQARVKMKEWIDGGER